MKLSEVAQLVYDTIDDLVLPQGSLELDLHLALDPLANIESGIQGIFVVPIVVDYNVESSNRRGTIKQLVKNPRIAVTIARPFAARDSAGLDVSSWGEVVKILDLREFIDEAVAKLPNVMGVDPEPPLETTYDKRWYLSVTEFYFDQVQC